MERARSFDKKIGCLHEVFGFIDEFLAGEGLGEGIGLTINLVAEELFTNMVRHNSGSAHPIEVSLTRVDDEVRLSLVDTDVEPFDPADAAPVDVHAPIEERRPGGLGLHLVRSMVDSVTYRYDNREMTVLVRKKVG
jgi:serine/threonine-protein kinase RsbW